MANAELGDDVYGEDPTVNRLEERAAQMLGTEAAMLVISGTMGNRIGLLVNVPRGHAVLADSLSHAFLYEAGGAAMVGGIHIAPIATNGGVISAAEVDAALTPDDPHFAPLTAVCIENTHNRHGGAVWTGDELHALRDSARANRLRVHLDGARLFNAAVATGMSARDIVACADSVTFCLSKGLACPVGSVFCGSEADIHEARRWRKMLGGGMRQAGIIAAAGLVALDTMIDRLAEDHANARTLAGALAEMPGVTCDADRVDTNMVYARVADAERFATTCASHGVLCASTDPTTVRFVTHYGIDAGDIQAAIDVCVEVLRAVGSSSRASQEVAHG